MASPFNTFSQCPEKGCAGQKFVKRCSSASVVRRYILRVHVAVGWAVALQAIVPCLTRCREQDWQLLGIKRDTWRRIVRTCRCSLAPWHCVAVPSVLSSGSFQQSRAPEMAQNNTIAHSRAPNWDPNLHQLPNSVPGAIFKSLCLHPGLIIHCDEKLRQ